MRAVILAAGKGTRLSRHIQNVPKCCVTVKGAPLVKNTIRLLREHGVRDIALVTGYRRDYIADQLKGIDYRGFYNPFFDVTNSIASLWFAKDYLSLDEDLLLLNGDVFFERTVLDALLGVSKTPLLLADSSRVSEADYRFQWTDERLVRYGKELGDRETSGEYVGIARIGKDFIGRFVARLEKLISEQRHQQWWEDVLYSFVAEGETVYVQDVKGLFWAEVDIVEDYLRILKHLNEAVVSC